MMDNPAKTQNNFIHSFTRSQAIEFAEWCFDGDNPYTNNFTTSDLYDFFLDHQKQQQEIKSNQ